MLQINNMRGGYRKDDLQYDRIMFKLCNWATHNYIILIINYRT